MIGIFIAGAVTGLACFCFGYALCAFISGGTDNDER